MPTNRDRAAAIRALEEAAERVNRRREAAAASPLEVAAQRLVDWAGSRPDLNPPVDLDFLRRDRKVPAGRPVVVDGQLRYLALEGPMVWPLGPLVDRNPVALLLDTAPGATNDPEDVLFKARKLATIQLAAAGYAPAIARILDGTGHPRSAQLVHEQDCEDWLMAPLGFPKTLQLLAHAFAGPEYGWERDVLEQACIAEINWENNWPALPAGVLPVPIPD
jgi:hypothetical protein